MTTTTAAPPPPTSRTHLDFLTKAGHLYAHLAPETSAFLLRRRAATARQNDAGGGGGSGTGSSKAVTAAAEVVGSHGRTDAERLRTCGACGCPLLPPSPFDLGRWRLEAGRIRRRARPRAARRAKARRSMARTKKRTTAQTTQNVGPEKKKKKTGRAKDEDALRPTNSTAVSGKPGLPSRKSQPRSSKAAAVGPFAPPTRPPAQYTRLTGPVRVRECSLCRRHTRIRYPARPSHLRAPRIVSSWAKAATTTAATTTPSMLLHPPAPKQSLSSSPSRLPPPVPQPTSSARPPVAAKATASSSVSKTKKANKKNRNNELHNLLASGGRFGGSKPGLSLSDFMKR